MKRVLVVIFFVQATILSVAVGRASLNMKNSPRTSMDTEDTLKRWLELATAEEEKNQRNTDQPDDEERFSFMSPKCPYDNIQTTEDEKLIGGVPVRKQSMRSWFVEISRHREGDTYESLCGGTMISNNLILSAAHCFDILPGYGWIDKTCHEMNNFFAAVWSSRDRRVRITKVYVPKNYNKYSEAGVTSGDVALAVLSRDIAPEFISPPLCFLNDEATWEKEDCLALGIGYTASKGKAKPHKLLELDTEVHPCENKLNHHDIEHIRNIKCIPRGPLKGDSGGPIICKPKSEHRYYLSGVISQKIQVGATKIAIITDMTGSGCRFWLSKILNIKTESDTCEDTSDLEPLAC